MSKLRAVPVTLDEARAFVSSHHRHNKPPVGQLPKKGEKRQDKRSPDDPTAGRIDERRHRPGKESRDES